MKRADLVMSRPARARALDAELVADHVRALRTGPLTQVVSTDRHTALWQSRR